MRKRAHDLDGLMDFAGRPAWRRAMQGVLGEHFGTVLDTFEVEHDELAVLLGDQTMATLWGCAFEDFLTRELPPDGRNVVDAYLGRPAAKEGPEARAYMTALRGSCMSLHEVVEVSPGRGFSVRDMILGGAPVAVRERSASRALQPFDVVAARIVAAGDGHVMGGGVLRFSREVAERLAEGLGAPDAGTLRANAPAFTTAWLLQAIPQALASLPAIRNSDGEEPELHRIRYPLAKGVRQADLAARLGAVEALASVRAKTWDWLSNEAPPPAETGGEDTGLEFETLAPDGRLVLGHVEIAGRDLTLTTASASRAARGRAMIEAALGDLVLAPETEIERLDDPVAEDEGEAIPLDVATELVHRTLDAHYRRTLDEPVPALGGRTPRAAAKTAKGRAEVAKWLGYLESSSAGRGAPDDPMATYDFGWIWRELGIARRGG